ncbi:MAG: glucoamylase family protein [Bacteroidota bacterium]
MRHSVLRLFGRSEDGFPLRSDESIRSELFSIERLEQHAESLAAAQPVSVHRETGRSLVSRLKENSRILLSSYHTIATAVSEEQVITPAAEWLVDNYHIVDEQIREIHDDLPSGFYRQLPKLADGPLHGYPRVFGIAWAFIAHTDSRFDYDALIRFVRAYQKVQPLTIGELWAVAITLRIVLVENLRRAAERIVNRREERQEANAAADRLLGAGQHSVESPDRVLKKFKGHPLPKAFAVQLVLRLRDQDPALTPALLWLDERLAAQGTTSERIVNEEHQHQGATSITVRNIITSMRLMSSIDWPDFFERVSLVDEALCGSSNFGAMDFQTRDSYRHAIEALSRGSLYTEQEITERVITSARSAAGTDQTSPEHDPGFYLLSYGRRAFEKLINYKVSHRVRIDRIAAGTGMRGYLVTLALVSGFILALPLLGVATVGYDGVGLFLLALLAVIPLSEVAVALVNHWITKRIGPKALPGLALKSGVPPDLRTMVVIPTILSTVAEIEEQIERLEVHFLANQDGDVSFAILSDWRDAPAENVKGDDLLLRTAVAGITRLNLRYAAATGGDRFFLFHRRRLWNEVEQQWMGWERKRGKLHELNRLLRGAADTSYLQSDPMSSYLRVPVPTNVRYVITLDSDTRLPLNAVRNLVGKMAHPLNRPKLDERTGRVIEGYAVLQPRVTPALPSGHAGSFFQHIFSGPGGIDPYAFVVSDVYQDLFEEGSYSGKGIYDVDVFEAALTGRIPENTVLSHDLLEGIFAGSGLVTDIEVVEEFPSRYDVAALRQHRWVRGDWQLLPWILGYGWAPGQRPARRNIPLTGRWKMIDNLRRSLSAPAAFLALLGGWTLPYASAAVWSGFILLTIALPPLLPFFSGIIPMRKRISKRSHLRSVVKDLSLALSQIVFHLSVLAHQAWLMSDAIVRTVFRLFVSHRNMLEWVTAAQSKTTLPLTIGGFYRRMIGGVVLTFAAGSITILSPHESWLTALPFLALWMVSPVIAQWVSRSSMLSGTMPVSYSNARVLRTVARKTWRFFETFVNLSEHMLPPDNFQEEPKPTIANRTSPTNIGLYLLSTAAAHDFGWIGKYEMADRLDATLSTMNSLERFHGHLYNWYDTRDLRPLDPKYISSVDSGNLAGHLIAVGNACLDMNKKPLVNPEWTSGIHDAVILALDAISVLPAGLRLTMPSILQVERELEALTSTLSVTVLTPASVTKKMEEILIRVRTVSETTQACVVESNKGINTGVFTHVEFWINAIQAAVKSQERDSALLKPWSILEELTGQDPELMPESAAHRLCGSVPSLTEYPIRCTEAVALLSSSRSRTVVVTDGSPVSLSSLESLIEIFAQSAISSRKLLHQLESVKEKSMALCRAMEFEFLFDEKRHLLSIGYRVSDGIRDPSCYDLLASEARLASFVAIAKGDIPVRHWFHLGRSLTPVDRGSALISWSGSMFEYLMPSLVMRTPEESLLGQTNRFIVRRQRQYGKARKIPWGVSESAYNVHDIELTYQYSNFGIPGLGLKRGLSKDAVIAPYATALAAMVEPDSAAENFIRLANAGGSGMYGYFEALDYTPARLPDGHTVAIVRAYMAHHQGMTIVAIDNALNSGVMCDRFHAEPMIQATELLLQERTPRDVAVARPRAEEVNASANVRELIPSEYGRFHSPHGRVPRTHILSNNNYAVMITGAGSGYSQWRTLAVTRWREDGTCDDWGSFVYLRDTQRGTLWSAGFQPTCVEPESYDVEFSEDRVEIARRDGDIATTFDIIVSPESDAEVRRVSLTNHGAQIREIELTSYAEVVLMLPASDRAHPAFSKLFVQTEFIQPLGTLLATRRRRSPEEKEIWAAHRMVIEGTSTGEIQFETDRARFLGRGHTVRSPFSVQNNRPLTNTAGTVLDPIFSLRCRVQIPPGTTARVAFWTMVAPTRTAVLDLADKHCDATAFERAVTLAWTQAQVQLHHLGISQEEAHLFQHLAGHILYSNPSLRPSSDTLKSNTSGQAALWANRISGDLPIVLIRIDDTEELEIVKQLLRAHEYWRIKLLSVDVVILNEQTQSYEMDLQSALETILRTNESQLRPPIEGGAALGKIVIIRGNAVAQEVRTLLKCAARAVLYSRRGSLSDQLNTQETFETPTAQRNLRKQIIAVNQKTSMLKTPSSPSAHDDADSLHSNAEYPNGMGGFTSDGCEYTTVLKNEEWTPMPWINVIANPSFGFHVSAEGSGYTWSLNSRENQLTPWSNDPVSDRSGEVFYVKDEHTGELWTPTAIPIRETTGHYTSQHGQGFSRFQHTSHAIALELMQYVALNDPIKISRLTIKNISNRNRRLSITAYVEWVLASVRESSAPFLLTEIDGKTGALFARNPWRTEFRDRVAFADLGGHQMSYTGDRKEFIGRNGSSEHPAALSDGTSLSNRVGAGFDPCCALQTRIELGPHEQTEILFLLGETSSKEEAQNLVSCYRSIDRDEVLKEATTFWNNALGKVQVKTPDRSMDILLNRWLLYQTVVCRMWARSAFYQAGGAYGFRDQLQDGLAVAAALPAITREHLLRAAGRQFVEGDVQHWWIPSSGRGVRTHNADDKAWLPYAVAHYIQVTNDHSVLDEMIPYLEGDVLLRDQSDEFFQPEVSSVSAPLFEHCALALEKSLTVGLHGLPLFGSGDWNDGMNTVGKEGKGESVWLGWFLCSVVAAFVPIAQSRGDRDRADTWLRHAAALRQALNIVAWDGKWFIRGMYDDGTVLGSSSSDECRIDSIAQSWGIISGAASADHAAISMASVNEKLIRRDDKLVLLFAPPFDKTSSEPGYIKGYPPGIRENGGQYTHGAIWSAIAFALLGEGNTAGELFSLLNPINLSATKESIDRYKVEPYVISADIYSQAPHVGRGGWSWYTGSAGWMYRLGMEWILGVRVNGKTLLIDPCIPSFWSGFELQYRYHSTLYTVIVENPTGVCRGIDHCTVNGAVHQVSLIHEPVQILLEDDGAKHDIRIVLGNRNTVIKEED